MSQIPNSNAPATKHLLSEPQTPSSAGEAESVESLSGQADRIRRLRDIIARLPLNLPFEATPDCLDQLSDLRGEAQTLALECFLAMRMIHLAWSKETSVRSVVTGRSAASLLGDIM